MPKDNKNNQKSTTNKAMKASLWSIGFASIALVTFYLVLTLFLFVVFEGEEI